jgi:hypothetical protein
MDISDMYGVDPNMVSMTVHESEQLPAHCYLCDVYTDRYVRLEGDEESALEKGLRSLGLILTPPWLKRTDEFTSNVYIDLPQCESCAELEDPTPIQVDYENQTMTFVVHRSFKERVQPTPLDTAPPENDETSDDENTE